MKNQVNQNHIYTWSISAHNNVNKWSWCAVWSTVLFVARLSGVKLLKKRRLQIPKFTNTKHCKASHTHTHIYFETQICIILLSWYIPLNGAFVSLQV